MSAKLFIGNLEYSVTSDDLRDYFATVGSVVDAVVIMDKMSGRSRGFGFVEYATEEEAKAAVEKLNGTELKGRMINVNEARPQNDQRSAAPVATEEPAATESEVVEEAASDSEEEAA